MTQLLIIKNSISEIKKVCDQKEIRRLKSIRNRKIIYGKQRKRIVIISNKKYRDILM